MKMKPPAYTYRAKWNPESKVFCGTCLEIETITIEAKSLDEAIKKTKEAAFEYVKTLKLESKPIPVPLIEKATGIRENE